MSRDTPAHVHTVIFTDSCCQVMSLATSELSGVHVFGLFLAKTFRLFLNSKKRIQVQALGCSLSDLFVLAASTKYIQDAD